MFPSMQSLNGQRDLHQLLSQYGLQQCQDPRDKIYGLLSLVTIGGAPRVDYSISVEVLFTQTLRCLATNSCNAGDFHSQFGGEQVSALVNALQLHSETFPAAITELHPNMAESILAQRFELALRPKSLAQQLATVTPSERVHDQVPATPILRFGRRTRRQSLTEIDIAYTTLLCKAPPLILGIKILRSLLTQHHACYIVT